MKMRRMLAALLSFLLLTSAVSCMTLGPVNETRPQNEGSQKDEDGGDVAPVGLANDGMVVSEDTTYFSAEKMDFFTLKPEESSYVIGTATGADLLCIMVEISNTEKIAEMYSRPDLDESKYAEVEREYRRKELFVLDENGRLQSRLNLNDFLSDEMVYINSIQVSSKGNIYLIGTGEYDENTQTVATVILEIDSQGNPVGDSRSLISEKEDGIEYKTYGTLAWDNSENLYVSGYFYTEEQSGAFVEVFDAEGVLLFTLQDEMSQDGTGWSIDGSSFYLIDGVVYTTISSYSKDKYENFLVAIDIENQQFADRRTLDFDYWSAQVWDDKIFFSNATGFYAQSIETGKRELVFNWKDLDVSFSGNYCTPLVLSADKIFVGADEYDEVTQTSRMQWYCFTREETNPNAGKKIIQMGGYFLSSETEIMKLIKDFNEGSKEYRLEILDFGYLPDGKTGKYFDYGTLEKEMNMMILSGDVPDILIGDSYNSFDFPLYASRGVLADLNVLMENDSDFNKKDYADVMFSLPATGDKLYYTFMSFHLAGILAKQERLDGKGGWSLDEMEALLDGEFSGTNHFPNESQSMLLDRFLGPSFASYVDFTERTVDFESDSFMKLLEFCKKYGTIEQDGMHPSPRLYDSLSSYYGETSWIDPRDAIRNGDWLFAIDQYCYTPQDWKFMWNSTGGDVTLAGFPGGEETSVVCVPGTIVALSSNRGNQDVAWEIVKSLLQKDVQKRLYSIPVLNEAREDMLQVLLEPETDSYMQNMPEYAPLPEEGVQAFREILERTSTLEFSNEEIMSIISEETGAFFSGQKSVDDVARIIQDRVTTYVNQL